MTTSYMPPITCPDWCTAQEEHRRDWEETVELFSRDNHVPHTDGTVGIVMAQTPEEVAQTWHGPLHNRTLARIALEGDEKIRLDLGQSADEAEPYLYLDAQGPITPAQAREAAEALLRAADELERVTA